MTNKEIEEKQREIARQDRMAIVLITLSATANAANARRDFLRKDTFHPSAQAFLKDTAKHLRKLARELESFDPLTQLKKLNRKTDRGFKSGKLTLDGKPEVR